MLPFFNGKFANPSSTHHFGKIINKDVENSRAQIARIIGANLNEITITSGATESINLAIKGIALKSNDKRHIITVQTEHKAVLDCCKYLESIGYEVDYLGVDQDGLIDLSELKSLIKDDTLLVSIMWVNNETGVIQNIKEIGEIVQNTDALFMTDATQAVGKIEVNVEENNIDVLCFSAHKFYGPKGIGALYLNSRRIKKNNILVQIQGGGQEKGLRSGTLNVPSIIGFGKACEIASFEKFEFAERIKELRDFFEFELLKNEGITVNGSLTNRLYNTSNVSIANFDANVLIGQLNSIAISNGSACNSAVFEPSYVLKSMGIHDELAYGSLRFSFGKFNTMEEIKTAIGQIENLLKKSSHA
jgi:cysteine desulfurase